MVFHNVAVCPRPPDRQWISLQPERSRNPACELSLVSNKVITCERLIDQYDAKVGQRKI